MDTDITPPQSEPAAEQEPVSATASDVVDSAVSEVVDESAAPEAAVESNDGDGPSVDELEGRLGEVEQAMAHLQSGALDDAEAAIASLDQRIGSTSD